MKTRKVYTTPKIVSEEVKIGVFGCYGGTGQNHPGGGNWWGDWFGGWWDIFFGRKRRR